ncbi:SIMPL domain-containing protein [Sinomonas atrocyanea]
MSSPDSITVVGTGSVTVVPDIAVLRVGAEVRSARLGEAYDGASRASEAIVAAALRSGVTRSDIVSASLSVAPELTWEEGRGQRLVGYVASRGLTIGARDLARTGELLDAVVAAGGGAVRIHGISLGVSDQSAAEASAQEAAFREAQGAARRLAALAARELGAVVRIDAGEAPPAGPGQPVPLRRASFAAAEASAPLEAGETEVQASVTVTWALADRA